MNINEIICDHFNITIEEMMQKSRADKYRIPRQIGMYFHKKVNDYTLKQISYIYFFTNSNILNGIKRVNNYIDTDKQFKAKIELLNGLIEKEIESAKLAEQKAKDDAEKERLYQIELEKIKSEPEFLPFVNVEEYSECV